MNAITKNEMMKVPDNFKDRGRKFGAIGGFFCGLTFLMLGIILSIFSFFEKIDLDRTELILLVTAFILLGLGAHCLDLIEKDKRKI